MGPTGVKIGRWLWPALVVLAGCRSPRRLDPAKAQAPALGPELATNLREESLRTTPLFKGKRPEHVSSELSPSVDGRFVTYASHRNARFDALSPGARAAFEKDPHSLDDIYVERVGSGQPKRLTRDAYRNDQPAFSPDGRRVAFTHHAADGQTSEIFTVGVDDLEVHQVTRLDALSARATYHPSGDYLAFTSRAVADGPVTVLVIDAQGRHDPLRVAEDLRGDVVVEFEAHGEGIAWTSNALDGRRMRRRAKWNDRLARRRLGQKPVPPLAAAEPRAWVEYLADPWFEGRPTGGKKEADSNAAIIDAFRELGLRPRDRTYEMPFSFVSEVTLGNACDLELSLGGATAHLALSGDWIPTSISATGEFAPAPIVFAGYGIVAPSDGGEPAYDAYGDLDVTDKWVAIFSGLPTRLEGARRFFFHERGRLLERALHAQARGAAGLLVFDDPATPAKTPRLRTFGRPAGVRIPVLRLHRRLAERLFSSQGTTVAAWAEKLADGNPAQLAFPSASARASVEVGFRSAVARNVLAQIEVPGATASLLVGAYADGMGRGERGGSLDPRADVIHPGANANASGVAALIAVAERLRRRQREGTFSPKQNVVFATWSAGEMGGTGSLNFANRKSVDVALNLRALGGERPALTARGTGSSPQWLARLGAAARVSRVTLLHVDETSPDDAASFKANRIPAVTLSTGPFASDRTALDQPERVAYANLDHAIQYVENLVVQLTSTPEPGVFTANSGSGRRSR